MPASYVSPRFVALDDKGTPLVGARLYTFANKSTTPKATYRDASGSAANTNPVILDANGSAVLYLTGNELYTFVLKDQFDVLLWTQDDILGQLDLSDLDAAVDEATRKSTEAAQQAALDANRAEAAASAAAIAGRVFDTPALGIENTTNGQYFSVPADDSQESLILYRNSSGNAIEVKRYPSSLFDSLTANRGKTYPMREMVRAGQVSPASTHARDAFLRITVSGPAELLRGKYFKIAYLQNGAVISGSPGYGVRIEEFEAADFESVGQATVIHATSDAPANYDRVAGGIQTFTISPEQRPDIEITITLDADGLPPYGEQLQMGSETLPYAWSWIIDPDCYVAVPTISESPYVTNRGKPFPLKEMERAGVVSNASLILNRAVRDIQVVGPAEVLSAHYFRLAYLQNGATLFGKTENGIRIEMYPRSTYATTGEGISIHAPGDTPADYDRDAGGIQSFSLQCAEDSRIAVKIVLGVDDLPPKGTAVNASASDTRAAWSWIIDPDCYFPSPIAASPPPPPPSGLWTKPTFVEYDALTGHLDTVAVTGSGKMTQFRFRPNGFNNLPNPHGLGVAAYGDPSTANFSSYNANTSEWFGVMHIRAVDGDGAGRIATGGNHGSSGGAGGEQTARNLSYEVYADGRRLESNYVGYADQVEIAFTNELMAYNTITLGRYVLRQSFSVFIRGNAVSVDAEYVALEPLYVQRDSGLQMVSSGYTDSVIFPGGLNTQRNPFDTFSSDSGPSSAAPDAWALVLKGLQGQIAMWMDRTFGLASNTQHVAPSQPLVRAAKSSSTKVYNSLVYGADVSPTPDDTALLMQTGDSYRWRGGYTWSVPSAYQPGIDSEICRIINGIARHAVVFSDASYSRFDA